MWTYNGIRIYVTDMDERCLAAYNILKFAEKEEKESATQVE